MYYNIHTHSYSKNSQVIEIVNQYPNQINTSFPIYSVGIHPWYLNENDFNQQLKSIQNNIQNTGFKAVGECGLDKRIDTPLELQKKLCIPQLLLAEKYKKPIILHCVAAFQEIIQLKKELKLTTPMIIHGFSKNAQVAESLIKNGFYLSFGKYLLLKPELATVLKTIPTNKLFLETDTIEQSIFEVYEKAEEILGISIKQQIEDNYHRVFNQ